MKAKSKIGESGFSVVELLVVVAVIMIIVAIALPRMSQARAKAKEAAAISSMKTVQTAQVMYANSFPDQGFAKKLAFLGNNDGACTMASSSACMIDSVLASGVKGGYTFDLKGDGSTPESSYSLMVSPQGAGGAGQCSFVMDQSGTITAQASGSGGSGGLSMGGGGGGSSGCGM